MKLPSLRYLWQQAVDALIKYPLVLASGAIAVFFGIYLIEVEPENPFPFINALLGGYLGVPLFLAANIYANSNPGVPSLKVWLSLAGVFMLAGVYFYLPDSSDTLNTSIPYIRYTILAIAGHLLVSLHRH